MQTMPPQVDRVKSPESSAVAASQASATQRLAGNTKKDMKVESSAENDMKVESSAENAENYTWRSWPQHKTSRWRSATFPQDEPDVLNCFGAIFLLAVGFLCGLSSR
jgi:hypothetical protein